MIDPMAANTRQRYTLFIDHSTRQDTDTRRLGAVLICHDVVYYVNKYYETNR